MSRTSMDVCSKRFIVLTTLVGVSLLVAGSWQAWNWFGYNIRRVPQADESSSDQSATDIYVTDEDGVSEHPESRTATGRRHRTTRDKHREHHHHHEHHHHQHRHAKTLSAKSQGSQSKHTSGAHRETERLLHPRSQTEPNYSATPHEHPEVAKRSSQILSFHDTHDEPASISHPDEQPEEFGKKRGVSSLSRSRDDTRPYPTNGAASQSIEDGHGKYVSVDDLRSILEGSVERILGSLRVERPEDFSDYVVVHDVPRTQAAPSLDVPGRRYRSLALEEGRLRKEAYESSKRAYKSGRKSDAKKLSDQGKLHDENMKKYNALAAAEIFAANNPRYHTGRQLTRCDLHGLHVDEAVEYSKNHLVNCRAAGTEKTMLIVGKGSHSQQGGARIKPAIMAMLEDIGGVVASLHEKNEGCIVVEYTAITPGRITDRSIQNFGRNARTANQSSVLAF